MSDNTECSAFAWPDGYSSAITFSFDDGRLSQLNVGIPLFEQLEVPATFYVMPERAAKRADDWRAAIAAGHEIGNHTMTHPCSANFDFARKKRTLDEMTLDDIEKEIVDANAMLTESLGVTPQTFAHPCGQKYVGRGANNRSYTPVVARHFIVGRGFKDESHNCPAYGDLAQCMGVDCDSLGAYELVPMLKRSNQAGGWLFLAGHDIGEEGFQVTRTDTIRALVEYCHYNNIWIDTAENIGRYILSQKSQ